MITIVDYGAGNLRSILNMLKKLEKPAIITSRTEEIEKAEKIILPGVGAFDHGMSQLRQSGLIDVLNKKALEEKVPVLGICLGVQLFAAESEEGEEKGLGWLDMKVIRFRKEKMSNKLKIPHMGWNEITIRKESQLLTGMYENPRFYFVHSYHMVPGSEEMVLATSNHGYQFTAAVEQGNIAGVQFHPEKSHKFGMKLLNNFAENY